MFKKMLIIGLLAIVQSSLGMENGVSVKELEKEYKYFWVLENEGLEVSTPDWKAWQQQDEERWERIRFKMKMKEWGDFAKTAAAEYAKVYGAAYGLTYAHEVGHWAASRLLLKEKGIIWVPFIRFLPCEGFYRPDVSISKIIKHFFQNPKDIFNMTHIIGEWPANHESRTYRRTHYAAMLAAGPIAGCLASYLLLKGNTLYNEYEKNENNLESALREPQKQGLFNSNQNFLLQFLVALNLQGNLFCSFYPWGNQPTQDGDRMLDALKIKNPRPLLRKTIGMSLGTLTACALGKSIFDAWKDKF